MADGRGMLVAVILVPDSSGALVSARGMPVLSDAGVVAGPAALDFAGLLRTLRARAELTQEELAESAGISPRSVSDLERGINRTARKDTALLLAGALNLTSPVRELFVAAARGKVPSADVLATPLPGPRWSCRCECGGCPSGPLAGRRA